MSDSNNCPKCNSENTYQDMNQWVCPECFHEWTPAETTTNETDESQSSLALDSNGNALNTGDSVTVIKDLKVKGNLFGIKAGTKVKNIKIIDAVDGHNVSCKIDGIGAMFLKSEVLKKA